MLDKLLARLKSGKSNATTQDNEIATPDISRVIKMATPPPPPAETVEEAPAETSDTEEMESRAEAALDDLSGQFETWMKADLDRLLAAWFTASSNDATPEQYREVFTAAHNIRGVAPSYGFPAISRLAASLCTLLSDTRPGDNSALINLHIEACRAAYKSTRQTGGADTIAEAVCEALEQKVAAQIKSA